MVGPHGETDSFSQALRTASKEAWSGRISVSVDGRQVGAVVLRAGRIAWAVCANQPEDLGTFLWRLGRVTREDLDVIRKRYEEHQGQRKLGALMEEAGILPRSVLQRCLLLHTRRAMSCLATYPKPLVHAERTELTVEESMTFSLGEVVPKLGDSEFPQEASTGAVMVGRWSKWTAENRVLGELSDLPGYLAAGVFAREGEVLAAHAAGEIDPVTIGVFVVSVLESSARTVRSAGLGAVSTICLECDMGTIVTQWLDERRNHVVVVVIESSANTGMARYKVGARAPSLATWAGEWQQDGQSAKSSVGVREGAAGRLE